MKGWILSGVSAPHGVPVQKKGLGCARRAQSTVDVFTTSTDRVVFSKSYVYLYTGWLSELLVHEILYRDKSKKASGRL